MHLNEGRRGSHDYLVIRRGRGVRRPTPQFVLLYSRRLQPRKDFEGGRALITLRHRVLCIIGLLVAASGCGTTHAILNIIAPRTAKAGAPFTVTVNVLYQGKPDTVINSRIHFTSSDPAAVLPADYYFTQADAGSHTWSNGFTLATPGDQTISGAIADASGINGNALITVSP